MQIGGAGDQAADLPIGRRPVLSPESQPPLKPSSQSKLTNQVSAVQTSCLQYKLPPFVLLFLLCSSARNIHGNTKERRLFQKCYLRRILSSYDKFRLLKLSRFPFVLFHRCPYLYFLVRVFYLFLSFCLEYFFSTSRNLSAAACVKLHMEFVLSGCESVWGKTESGQSLFSLSAFPPYSPYTLSLCLCEESIALNDAGITHLPAFLADQLLVCPLHHFYFTML